MTGRRKHAYLILCHNHFQQLAVLLRLLDHPRNDIFLHVDKKAGDLPEQELRDAVKQSGLFFTRRISVNWGAYSMVEAELILLEAALGQGDYQYVHLLSGQDLPLKSQDAIHAFFDASQGKEYVRFFQDTEESLGRLKYYLPLRELCGRDPWHPVGFAARVVQRLLLLPQYALGVDRQAGVQERFYYGTINEQIRQYAQQLRDKRQHILQRDMRITATIDELCAFSEQFILKMGISFLKRQNSVSPNTAKQMGQ